MRARRRARSDAGLLPRVRRRRASCCTRRGSCALLSRDDQDAVARSRGCKLATQRRGRASSACAATRCTLLVVADACDVDGRCRTSRASSSAQPMTLARPAAAAARRARSSCSRRSSSSSRSSSRTSSSAASFRPVDQLINEVEAITDGRSLHRRLPADASNDELVAAERSR